MLPVWSCTIAILRAPIQTDAYPDVEPVYTAAKTGIHAHFAINPRLQQPNAGSAGQRSFALARMTCDTCDLSHLDRVLNEKTGEQWEVEWVAQYTGPVPHTIAAVRKESVEVEAATV